MALLDRALVHLLPAGPRPIVRRIADRYIAGEEIDDAVATVEQLNAEKMTATIDVLGEEIHNADEAQEIVDAYHDTLDAIGGARARRERQCQADSRRPEARL